MLSCSTWFSAPSFWMGGGLESLCVGRVYGADGAVRVARHHPHLKLCIKLVVWLFFRRLYRDGRSTKHKKLMSVCQPSRAVIKSFQW